MSFYSPLDSTTISALVRKHVHDIRNCVNYLDLEFTLLEDELGESNPVVNISQLREQLGKMERLAQIHALRFSAPSIDEVAASDLLARWQRSAEALFPPQRLQWHSDVEQALIHTDLLAMSYLLTDILSTVYDPESAEPLQAQMVGQGSEVIFRVVQKSEEGANLEQRFSPWHDAFPGEHDLRVRMAEMAGGKWTEAWNEETREWTLEIRFQTVE